jgi:hypothetical protein
MSWASAIFNTDLSKKNYTVNNMMSNEELFKDKCLVKKEPVGIVFEGDESRQLSFSADIFQFAYSLCLN